MTKNTILLLFILASIQVTSQNILESIPIRFVENYIFIELKINDSEKPLNFLFDTGAGITVIDTQIAEQLSLDIDGESLIHTSGKSLLSKESASNTIKIGKSVVLEDSNLILLDLSHLSDYLNTNVDGVIGYDLLNEYVIETNIDRKEIRMYDFNTFSYQGKSEPIILTRLESNLFGIMINVIPRNGKVPVELNFQIDTGADNYLSFHKKTVQQFNLVDSTKNHSSRKGFGADSTISSNIRSKVKLVSFGGKRWKNIPVMFEVDPLNKRDNSLADGLIGQRLLLDFNIIYDLEKRLIYLESRN
jgi:predicted aspartyl protease